MSHSDEPHPRGDVGPDPVKSTPTEITPRNYLFLQRALHVGPELDDTIELCVQTALQPGGLHAIARLSAGIHDFAADVFEVPGQSPFSVGEDVERMRASCRSTARLVSHFVSEQDRKLEDVRTGRLIRVVIHAEEGAIFCFSVVPGQHIVGFTFDSSSTEEASTATQHGMLSTIPTIVSADQIMSEIVDTLREQISLPAQNLGAWNTMSRRQVTNAAGVRGERSLMAESLYAGGDATDPLSGLCRDVVDPVDLHLVSRYRGTDLRHTFDYLGHGSLARFFSLITVEARRKFYHDYSLELYNMAGQLGRLSRATVGGRVQRLVLDVEQGAIFYYRLQISDYLVGITIDQKQVNVADNKMSRLARQCQEIL